MFCSFCQKIWANRPDRIVSIEMFLELNDRDKVDRVLGRDPNVTISLRPIAAPAALGLAGFAGSTWITATYIAQWWASEKSPTIFFPFVVF